MQTCMHIIHPLTIGRVEEDIHQQPKCRTSEMLVLIRLFFLDFMTLADGVVHSCQPLLGVNLSPEFVNLYFPYAGWGLLFFRWYQQHFEVQSARVAVAGRSNVVLNMHAQLQISLLMRFLSLLH